MGVAGELTTIGLAEVFQNLAFNRLTGTLTLTQGEKRARIAVDEGRIRAVRVADRKLDYVAIARHAQAAPEEILETAASTKRRRTLRAFLLASGEFREDAYVAMVAGFVQEEILPLFGWRAGAFRFDEGPIKPRSFDRDQLECNVALDPMAVAMEAARRQDEWSGLEAHAPADGDILIPAAGLDASDVEESEQRLLELLDGTRTLAAAIKEGRIKKYDGMKAAARLAECGAVVPADPPRLRELAERNAARGAVHLAARQLEAAVALDEGDPETRRGLVRLYERSGEKAKAAAELLRLGERLTELGDRDGAVEAYERATVLAPTDLDALERRFQCHVRGGERREALRAGRRLAEALLAQDMAEDARPLYERLLREFGGGSGVREAYVQCLVRLDDPAGAARELLAIATAAYDRGEFAHALRDLRRVLELDASCAAAQERIATIESGSAQRREQRRRRAWRMTAMSLIVALFGIQGAREWRAVSALGEAQAAITTTLATDNGDDARLSCYRKLATVANAHAGTRGRTRAEELLRTMLVDEASRIGMLAKAAAEAEGVADVEYSDGRARRLLDKIAKLPLPEELNRYWTRAAAALRKRLDALRAD